MKDIEAWQSARELTRKIYDLTKKTTFALDYGLKSNFKMPMTMPGALVLL